MKNGELRIHLGGRELAVYLQGGFFDPSLIHPALHRHRYSEVHVMAEGEADMLIGNRPVKLRAGEAVAIPSGVLHSSGAARAVRRVAFQVRAEPMRTDKVCVPEGVLPALVRELDGIGIGAPASRLALFLGLVCEPFFGANDSVILPNRDRGFLIHEFFAAHYAESITLSMLAAELCLSEKQTERLLFAYTGNTFRRELSRRRIEMARHLLHTEPLSLEQVAARVGYRSYSGFWKAFHDPRNR